MAVVRKFWFVDQVFPDEYASTSNVSFAKPFTSRRSQMLILGRKVLDGNLLEVRSFGCLTVLPCRWLMYHWAVPLMDEISSMKSLRMFKA